jgi:hypothetical protein
MYAALCAACHRLEGFRWWWLHAFDVNAKAFEDAPGDPDGSAEE